MNDNRGKGAKPWLVGLLAAMGLWTLAAASAAAVEPLCLSTAPPAQEQIRGVALESEHRATPVRKYWLDTATLASEAKGCCLHPLGTVDEVPLTVEPGGISLPLNLPMSDGPMHGVHNSYVVERRIADRRQLIRVAKWITIHHSCGWGHDYKYDAQRIPPKSLATIPLEIVCEGLWDGNFHSDVRSGDTLTPRILTYGAPVKGARVQLTSGSGWSKALTTGEDGTATFQLIRDYYPQAWGDFHASHRDRFTIEAVYETPEAGSTDGQPYEGTTIVSTLRWVYSPARADYSSYALGLSIGLLLLTFTAIGVYAYRERRTRPYKEVSFDERD